MKRSAQHVNNPEANRRLRGNAGKGRSIFSRIVSSRPLNSFSVLVSLLSIVAGLGVLMFAEPGAEASSPNSGTVTLTSAPLNWKGTATAGGALGDPLLGLVTSEDMCIEGTS